MYCRPDISKESLSHFSHKCPHGTEGELCDKDLCKCHKINLMFYEGTKRERAQAASAQVTVFIVMMNTCCGRRGHFQRAADSLGFKARGSAVTKFSIYRSCSGWDPIKNDLALETLSITL